MLVTLKEICEIAEKRGIAVGAFNTPHLECLTAIIEAAEELDTPVILQHAEVHDSLVPIETIAPLMVSAAHRAKVPVCVHLDHGVSFDECMKALRLGFTSVMIDASALEYSENIAKTLEVVKAAHAMGVSVEAELGHILTSEGSVEGGINSDEATAADCYTDPEQARDFVQKTGVDALAISFGTAHGVYKSKPVLDLNRITQIKDKVDMPFVMHGGSGVSAEEFKTAIRNGIRKINYYTYMAIEGADAVKACLKEKDGDDTVLYQDLAIAAKDAMKENVIQAMRMFLLE